MSPKYDLSEVMTLNEAAMRYDVNLKTLKGRFRKRTSKVELWERAGLVRQSGNIWLVTTDFMELTFRKNEEIVEEG